jgi:cardiolipin synthase
MDKLLEAIEAVVCLLPPEKVIAISNRLRRTKIERAAGSLLGIVGTPTAITVLDHLINAWRETEISPEELASMLLIGSYVITKKSNIQSAELVWTGPTTPFVSARRTEQALLQVINNAEKTLFITSFVAYDVSNIVKALNSAGDRGVNISMLLELSQDEGGSITFDAIGKMSELVPAARLYAWRDKADPFSGGRVHAKVAVADGKMCFITSANLTGHAMEKNMEAGVILKGGDVARTMHEHLNSLIATNIITAYN